MKKEITETRLDLNILLILTILFEILYQITKVKMYRYFALFNLVALAFSLLLAIIWYFMYIKK